MADEKKRDDYTLEMGERNGNTFEPPKPIVRPAAPTTAVANNPILPILSYCGSSILMTVMNKFVLSGMDFNLNFFLLCVQVGDARTRNIGHRLKELTGCGMRGCDSDMQVIRRNHIPRLQYG